MFCYKCGKQIDDDAKFCENCGAVINDKMISSENVGQTGATNSNTSVKKEINKPLIITIIIVAVVLIAGSAGIILFDNYNHQKGDEAIKTVQDSYFEFLTEITVGDLIHEYYGENYWACNSDGIVEFWGTNKKDRSGLALHFSFTGKGIVDVPYIMYHEENETAHHISKKEFEEYILSLYAQLDDNYLITDELAQTTTEKATTTQITTTKVETTKAKSDDKTYSITFEADELIEEAGLQLGGHIGVAVLSNLTCSNGNANIETETIYVYDSLVRVEVTGAKAGEVVLGGTITTYGLDMFEGETVSYPDDSGVFLISKTVDEVSSDKPYVDGYVETYSLSGRDGSKIRLYLDGVFSAVSVQIQNQEYTSEVEFYSKEDFDDYIEMNFNPFAQPPSVAYVTPYGDSGVAGDVVTCDIPSDASGTIQTGGMSYPVDNMKGQINCHNGTVAGFTTDYVVNGGAVGKVRNSLGDTWHVTAKNACDNYGVTWYELWDYNDGDYYGWVDSSYIDFY